MKRRVDMRILKSMHMLNLPTDSPEISGDAYREFMRGCFPPLRHSDGSWTRSRPSRHSEVDVRLVEILRERGLRPEVFMDVGMGDGTSTLETIRCLEAGGFPLRTVATDRNLEAYVVRLHRNLDVLCEANGHLLLLEWRGWAFTPYCTRWDYLTGRFLPKMFLSAWTRRRLVELGLPLEARAVDPTRAGCAIEGPYTMVTPELKNRPDVLVRTDDVLKPLPAELTGIADVVRIVNVLRPDRFSPTQLRQVAMNIRQRCKDGAIVVVGRNRLMKGDRLRLAATFFQAEPGGRLRVVERAGAGVEVEAYFAEVGKA
jgi:hypothetical protein